MGVKVRPAEDMATDAETRTVPRARIVGDAWLRAHATHIALAILALAMIVAQSVWVYMDKQPPSWDPAHYLDLTLGHERALQSRGLPGFFSDVIASDPVRAPLLTMLAVPIFLVAGPGPDRGIILNLLLWPILLLAVYLLGRRLFTARTGLLAAFLTATTPIVFGLAHEFFIEFLLTTLVTVTVLLLLKTDGFARRGASVALGVAIGLGLLTKVTFPLYVAGPCLVLGIAALSPIVRARRHGERIAGQLAGIAVNICIIGALAVAIPFFWYVHDLKPSWEYAKWASNGAGSLPYGPAQPYKPDEIAKFTLLVINVDVSWLYVIVPLIGLAVVLVAWWRGRAGASVWRRTAVKGLMLIGWFAIPFWYVTLSHNHDPRFLAPAMPAFALLVAGVLARVPKPDTRRALVVGTVALGTFQWFAALFTVPALPDKIQASTPAGKTIVWWQGPQPRAHNHEPSSTWNLDEILTYLATENPSTSGVKPLTIGLLTAHPAFNPNTLSFFAHTRQLPFTFIDVEVDPAHPDEPSPRVQECDYILAMQQSGVSDTGRDDPSSPAFDSALSVINKNRAGSLNTQNVTRRFLPVSVTFPNPDGQAVLYARDKTALPQQGISHPVSVIYGGSIEFLGYDLAPYGKTSEGQVYNVTYYWRALRPVTAGYQVYVHIGSDPIIAGADHVPPASVGPTSQWVPGRIVQYTQPLFVPDTAARGAYPIRLGLFIPDTTLVPITAAPEGASDPLLMGALVGSLVIP